LKESKHQKKIIDYLKSLGWYIIKVSAATRAGVPDLICCDTKGHFWAFEVKDTGNVASKLQEYNIQQINNCSGSAFVVYNLEQVKNIINWGCLQGTT
jgi:Holliday junction resolvase